MSTAPTTHTDRTDAPAAADAATSGTSAFERRESAVRSYARSWPAVFATACCMAALAERHTTFWPLDELRHSRSSWPSPS